MHAEIANHKLGINMKRIRIDNDIALRWTILTNKEAVSLEGRDLRVELKSAYNKKQVDFTIEDNVIIFYFLGAEQRNLGVYSVILQETTGGIMRTMDECKAFELVPHSCMEGGEDENNLKTEVVELTSEVVIGMPGKPGLTPEEHDALVQATADANAAANRANGVIDDAERAAKLADDAREALTTSYNEKVAALDADYATKKHALDTDYNLAKSALAADYVIVKRELKSEYDAKVKALYDDYAAKTEALTYDYTSTKATLSTAYSEAIASINSRMSAIETQYATDKVEWQRQVDAILGKFSSDFEKAEADRETRVAGAISSANSAAEGANVAASGAVVATSNAENATRDATNAAGAANTAADHANTEANAAKEAAVEANAAAVEAREAAMSAMKPDMSNIDEAGKKKVNDVAMAGEVGQKLNDLSSDVANGVHLGAVSGLALNLMPKANTTAQEFVRQITGGSYAASVWDGGVAKIERVKGKTLKVAQKIQEVNRHISLDDSYSGRTIDILSGKISIIEGHRYLVALRGTNLPSVFMQIRDAVNSKSYVIYQSRIVVNANIFDAESTNTSAKIQANTETGNTIDFTITMLDLTEMGMYSLTSTDQVAQEFGFATWDAFAASPQFDSLMAYSETPRLINSHVKGIRSTNADGTSSEDRKWTTYLFEDGMKSAGNVYDEKTATKEVKRIKSIDMGTLKWVSASSGLFYYEVADRVYGITNIQCAKYSVVRKGYNNLLDKEMCGASGNSRVLIKDTDYDNATDFKNSLNGVLLYYETTDIEEFEYDELNLTYTAHKNGEEEAIVPEGVESSPLKADITYGVDAYGAIINLLDRVAALESNTAAIESALTAAQSLTSEEGE